MKGEGLVAPRHPDESNPQEDQRVVEELKHWIHKVFPGLHGHDTPNHTEPCIYTVSSLRGEYI